MGGENLMQANFELMIKYWFTESEKKKKVRAGGENLMWMEIGGIVGELFSYLFFYYNFVLNDSD